MDPLIGGALIGAGASLIGGGVSSGVGIARTKKQWQRQKEAMAIQQQYALEQMQKQYEYNTQFFDYQNAYNDPSKVFERYRKAGVTPAAVLGSSGVGVSATVPTSSASSIGGLPHASAPSPASGPDFLDPSSMAEMMLAKSSINRNDAAANRDNAEADLTRNQTQSKDYYASMAALNKSITEANVSNAGAVADMNRSLAEIYSIDADFEQWIKTATLNDLTAQWAMHNEEYLKMRKYRVEYMDKVLGAQISLDFARAYQASSSGDLNSVQSDLFKVQVADLQNWFDLNWNTPIDVPEVDSKGKPTGKTVQMTGKDIQEYLLGISATEASQGVSENWYKIRSQKNAFGYSMAEKALQGALQIAGAATLGGRAGAAIQSIGDTGTSTNSTQSGKTKKIYDNHGNLIRMETEDYSGTSDYSKQSTRRYRR